MLRIVGSFTKMCSLNRNVLPKLSKYHPVQISSFSDDSKKRFVEQYQVDAFATSAFHGSPACVLFEQRDAEWMQNIAMENNITTAFLTEVPDTLFKYNLRWFSPNKELELCGHGTLSSAHMLYETHRVYNRRQRLYFLTQHNGTISAVGKEDGTIELDMPVTEAVATSIVETQNTDESVGVELQKIAKSLGIASEEINFIGKSVYDLLVEVTPKAMKTLAVNHSAIAELDCRGVIVTCIGKAHWEKTDQECEGEEWQGPVYEDSEEEYDFISRFFAPRIGIPEDPVTGSAHCTLAPYWFNKIHPNGTAPPGTVLKGYQASQRGGVVHVAMSEGVGDRVLISGPAVTTMHTRVLV